MVIKVSSNNYEVLTIKDDVVYLNGTPIATRQEYESGTLML